MVLFKYFKHKTLWKFSLKTLLGQVHKSLAQESFHVYSIGFLAEVMISKSPIIMLCSYLLWMLGGTRQFIATYLGHTIKDLFVHKNWLGHRVLLFYFLDLFLTVLELAYVTCIFQVHVAS